MHHGGEKKFAFIPLQSVDGKKILKHHQLPENYLDSLVLVEDAKVYLRSGAALRIASRLNRPLRWISAFIMFPPILRDPLYNWISSYRNTLLDNQDNCEMPEKNSNRKTPATTEKKLSIKPVSSTSA